MSKRLPAPRLTLLLLASLLLAACATGPIQTGQDELARELQRVEDKPERALDYARRYQSEAGPRGQARGLLLQAEAELALKRQEALRETLKRIDDDALSRYDHMRLRCVRALAALEWETAPDAVKQLPGNDPEAPEALQRHVLRTQMTVLWEAGYKIDTLRSQLTLFELSTGDEREELGNSALQRLGALPDRTLEKIRERELTPALTSWSAFVLATKPQLFDLEGYRSAVALWRDRYPRSSLPERLIERLDQAIAKRSSYPDRVALLLPLSGNYSEQAASVRDGFLAAYYHSDRDELPALSIYDTRGNAEGLDKAIDRALEDEVNLIVGPLLKSAIAQLARRDDIRVPVLALNQLSGDELDKVKMRAPLFQFGLIPEDEGTQAARLAIVRNQIKALMLLPDNTLGRRLGEAFSEEYENFGGRVLATERYNPESSDYGSAVKSLLNITQSQSRRSILQTVLGRQVGYEPRRRQDVDVIYLAAQARQARSIKPLLKFHDAEEVPVLAASQAYDGSGSASINRDVEGLTFTVMPWVLKADETPLNRQLRELWPNQMARFGSLYALGADAFDLIPHLGPMAGDYQYHTGGYTGHLSADADRRIHRELMWAEYRDGEVVPVENDLLDLIPFETPDRQVEPAGGKLPLKQNGENKDVQKPQNPGGESATQSP
ncbi:MAG: penicillin-binding protein activator [Pseudomonadota bacterium]